MKKSFLLYGVCKRKTILGNFGGVYHSHQLLQGARTWCNLSKDYADSSHTINAGDVIKMEDASTLALRRRGRHTGEKLECALRSSCVKVQDHRVHSTSLGLTGLWVEHNQQM